MFQYLNFHGLLQVERDEALKNNTTGPRVIICGPSDVGKSTLAKLLSNYSIRSSSQLIFVDTDLGQGMIGLPGSISAFMVDKPFSSLFDFHAANPLVYCVGHNYIFNLTLTNYIVTQLANSVKEKMLKIPKLASGGVVINTCGYVTGAGFENLQHTIEAFDCNYVVVLDQERLHNQLSSHPSNSNRKVVFLQKSGGVIFRNQEVRRANREERIKTYFYGKNNEFLPRIFDLNFDEIKIYQIGAPDLPSSCLPIGMGHENAALKVICLPPNQNMLHHICAVCGTDEESEIITSPVFGFIVITSINMKTQKYTILSPSPAPLPKSSLILSDVTYMDLR